VVDVGVVFASTGGGKIVRALRSLRKSEPDLPFHVVVDVSSNTWKSNPSLEWLDGQDNIKIRMVENSAYINGNLNHAMRWMKELGYSHACLFHDDVIFSPLAQNRWQLSEWFNKMNKEPDLREASSLSLGFMQIYVPNVWKRSEQEWNNTDLESETYWQMLCPDGIPFADEVVGYVGTDGFKMHSLPDGTDPFPKTNLPFIVSYSCVKEKRPYTRLGPSGQIVPISTWELVGGFDEKDGIFYDVEYPAACIVKGLPPNLLIPNVPHLHLHNQSIGYADLATGIWSDTMGAFARKYGEDFWGKQKSLPTSLGDWK